METKTLQFIQRPFVEAYLLKTVAKNPALPPRHHFYKFHRFWFVLSISQQTQGRHFRVRVLNSGSKCQYWSSTPLGWKPYPWQWHIPNTFRPKKDVSPRKYLSTTICCLFDVSNALLTDVGVAQLYTPSYLLRQTASFPAAPENRFVCSMISLFWI